MALKYTYEGEQNLTHLQDVLKRSRAYNQADWDFAVSQGPNSAFAYAQMLQDVEANKIDYDQYVLQYRPNLGTTDYRLATLANELYGDRETTKTYKLPVYDEQGNMNETEQEMSEYDYNKYLYQFELENNTAEQRLQIRQSIKDSQNWFSRIVSDIASTAGHFLYGAMSNVQGAVRAYNFTTDLVNGALADLTAGLTSGVWSDENMQSAYDKLRTDGYEFLPLESIAQELAEFEMDYTGFRNLTGESTWIGSTVASIAESFGQAAPMIVFSLVAPQLELAQGAVDVIGTSLNVAYWTGMAGQNMQEAADALPEDTKAIAVWFNGAAKAALEYAVQEGLNKILEPTSMDKLMFGYQSKAELATGGDVFKKVLFDAVHEGVEEVLQDVSHSLVDGFVGLYDSNFGQLSAEELTIENLANAFVVSAISSILSSSVDFFTTERFDTGVYELDKNGNPIVAKYEFNKETNQYEAVYKTKKLGLVQSYIQNANFKTVMGKYAEILAMYKEDAKSDSKIAALQADKAQAILKEMYVAGRVCSTVYGQMGEVAYNNALKLLNDITEYNEKNVTTAAKNLVQSLKAANAAVNLDLIMKAEIANEKSTIKADATEDDINESLGEFPLDEDTTKKVKSKIKKLRSENPDIDIVITELGNFTVWGEKQVFIPIEQLKNDDIENIRKSKYTQELINNCKNDFKEEIAQFKQVFYDVFGKVNDDFNWMTDTDIVMNVLFNSTIQLAMLRYSNGATLRFFGRMLDMEASLKTSENVDEYAIVHKVTMQFNKLLAQYCALDLSIPEASIMQDYKFSLDEKQDAAIKEWIQSKRADKNLYQRIKDGKKLTKADKELIKLRANSSVVIGDNEMTALNKALDSNDNNTILMYMDMMLQASSIQYLSPFDGTTYPTQDTLQNIYLTNYLVANGDTLITFKNKAIQDAGYAAEQQKNFNAFTEGLFELVVDEQGNVTAVEISPESYRDVVESEELGGTGVLPKVYKEDKDKLRQAISKSRTSPDAVFVGARIDRADEQVSKLLSDELSDFTKSHLSVDDLIRNPEKYASEELLTYLKDNDYGTTSPMNVFLGVRAYIEESTNFESTIMVDATGTRYFIVDTTTMASVLKNSDIKSIENLLAKLEKNKKLKASDVFAAEYLVGNLANLTIKITNNENVYGYYDKDSNTIYLSLGDRDAKSLKRVRNTLAHEFVHAIQKQYGISSGFTSTWLVDMSNKALANKIVQDFARHYARELGSELANKMIKNPAKYRGQVSEIIYMMTNEYDAYGLYVSDSNTFYPVIPPSPANGNKIVFPWGKYNMLGENVASQQAREDIVDAQPTDIVDEVNREIHPEMAKSLDKQIANALTRTHDQGITIVNWVINAFSDINFEPFRGKHMDKRIFMLLTSTNWDNFNEQFREWLVGEYAGLLNMQTLNQVLYNMKWHEKGTAEYEQDKYTYDAIREYVFPQCKLSYNEFLSFSSVMNEQDRIKAINEIKSKSNPTSEDKANLKKYRVTNFVPRVVALIRTLNHFGIDFDQTQKVNIETFSNMTAIVNANEEMLDYYNKQLDGFGKVSIPEVEGKSKKYVTTSLAFDDSDMGFELLLNYTGDYQSLYIAGLRERQFAINSQAYGKVRGSREVSSSVSITDINSESKDRDDSDDIAGANLADEGSLRLFEKVLEDDAVESIKFKIVQYYLTSYVAEHPEISPTEAGQYIKKIEDKLDELNKTQLAREYVKIRDKMEMGATANIEKAKRSVLESTEQSAVHKQKVGRVRSLLTRINKSLSERTKKVFFEKNKKYFKQDENGKAVLNLKGKVDIAELSDAQLDAIIPILSQRLSMLGDKKGQPYLSETAYKQWIAKENKKAKTGKKPKAKKVYVEKIVYKKANANVELEIDSTRETPKFLKDLLGYNFETMTSSNVQFLTEEGVNDEMTKTSLVGFTEQNADKLATMTEQDAKDIVEYYQHTNGLTGEFTTDDAKKWIAIKLQLLSYIYSKHMIGDFKLDNVQVIKDMVRSEASYLGTGLSLISYVEKEFNPAKYIVKAELARSGIKFDEDTVEQLSVAQYRGDVEKMKELKQKLYAEGLKDYLSKNATKGAGAVDVFLRKVLAFERMAMLSSPGTWLRNFTSNQVLRAMNTGSAIIGDVTTKGIRKLLQAGGKLSSKKLAGLFKNLENSLITALGDQYQIVGTQVSAEVKKHIEEFAEFYNEFGAGTTKFDTRKLDENSSSVDIVTELIVQSVAQEVLQQNVFIGGTEKNIQIITEAIESGDINKLKEALKQLRTGASKITQTAYDMLSRMISDEAAIKKRAIYYFGKILTEEMTEKTVKVKEGPDGKEVTKVIPPKITSLSDSQNLPNAKVLELFVKAYTLASTEFMHKSNIMSYVEKTIAQFGGEKLMFVYKQFAPFIASTLNWTMELLKYNPIQLASALYRFVKLEKTIDKMDRARKKGYNIPDSRFAAYLVKQDIGKGVIGTFGLLLSMALGALGIIGVDDKDEKMVLKVGPDVSVDISEFFLSSTFLSGAYLVGVANKDNDYNFLDALRQACDSVFDNTVMSDVIDMFRYEETFSEVVSGQFDSFLSKFTPAILRNINGLLYAHNIQYSSGIAGTMERWFAYNIPGAAYLLPTKIDPYTGETQYASGGSLVSGWIYKATSALTDVKLTIKDVSTNEKEAISVGLRKGQLTGKYDDFTFDSKQVEQLNIKYGQLNDKLLTELRSSKKTYKVQNANGTYSELTYNKMTEEQKKNVINRIMTSNAKYAKIYVYTQSGGKYYATESEYKELRSLGITKNVYKETANRKGFK